MRYPENARIFRPTVSEAADTSASRIRSNRNVIRWSVDRILERLIEQAPLDDTVIIYTSDHGQALNPDRFTHCSVDGPDPREGLLPLFVITGNAALRARFQAAADASRGHGKPLLDRADGAGSARLRPCGGGEGAGTIVAAQEHTRHRVHQRRHFRPLFGRAQPPSRRPRPELP
jgi:arylsulfatase A-like enzyme